MLERFEKLQLLMFRSEEEEGMAEVQLLLKRVMDHKKAAGRKKEATILQVGISPPLLELMGRSCNCHFLIQGGQQPEVAHLGCAMWHASLTLRINTPACLG